MIKRAVIIYAAAAGILFLAASLIFGLGRRQNSESARLLCGGQPCNVILIVADTLGAKHMGLYGYERETTPFIDEFFGKNGIVFKNAWANTSWTLPSFASFFTSQYPSEIRVEEVSDRLSARQVTLFDVLARSGIKTVIMGTRDVWGFPPIFGRWSGNFALLPPRLQRVAAKESFLASDPLQFMAASKWIDAFPMEQDRNKPFFLFLHTFLVHLPYDPPPPYRSLFGAPQQYPGPVTIDDIEQRNWRQLSQKELERFRLQYDQEVRYLDDTVKDFIAELPAETLARTAIIFIADHGESFGEHYNNNVTHGGPLYEEVTHVPFLIRVPGMSPQMIDEPVSLLDLAPTILDIFGIKPPSSFRGKSLIPTIPDKPVELRLRVIRAEVAEIATSLFPPEKLEQIKIRGWYPQRIRPFWHTVQRHHIALRLGSLKFMQNADGGTELYLLDRDPNESNNRMSAPEELSFADRRQLQIILGYISAKQQHPIERLLALFGIQAR